MICFPIPQVKTISFNEINEVSVSYISEEVLVLLNLVDPNLIGKGYLKYGFIKKSFNYEYTFFS